MQTKQVAIITAGGSGMGAAAARRLAADGFEVAILSSSGKGEALAREIGGIGVTGSNQSQADLKRLVDAVMQRWGRIDVLVNSAGHGPKGALLEITDDDWDRGMQTYLLNVIRPTRLVTPVMVAQKSGVIINISTYAAFEPEAAFPTSGVFRAGLAAFTKLFADRYAADNVRMNNVLPGFIDSLPEKARFQAAHSHGRYGTTEEGRFGGVLPRFQRRRLHDGPEPARGRRHHPLGVAPHGAHGSASLRFLYARRCGPCTGFTRASRDFSPSFGDGETHGSDLPGTRGRPVGPDGVARARARTPGAEGGRTAVIAPAVLYGFGGMCALALFAYLVVALIRAEDF